MAFAFVALVVQLDLVLASVSILPVVLSVVTGVGIMAAAGRVVQADWWLSAVLVMTAGACFGLVRVIELQRSIGAAAAGRARFSIVVAIVTVLGIAVFSIMAAFPGCLSTDAAMFGAIGTLFAGLAALFMIPSILEDVFRRPARRGCATVGGFGHLFEALKRYRHLDVYPRMYAAVKLMIDPMFPRLADHVPDGAEVLDIGCGFGIPGVWLSVVRPNMHVTGLEPSASRVRIARLALGDRGRVFNGIAPDLPEGSFDVVLLLDVIYWLDDEDLSVTLDRVVDRLAPGGKVVLRVLVPGGSRLFWRRVETLRGRMAGIPVRYRSRDELAGIFCGAGLKIDEMSETTGDREEVWFIMVAGSRPDQVIRQ